MTPIPAARLVEIDPRNIVNDSHARMVTKHDIALMEKSFLEHGYIRNASPISVRCATTPEICSFYQRPPHKYSLENATKLTLSISSKADFENHVYAYDGLIRKATVLLLQDKGHFSKGFRLCAMLVPAFSERQAIAYGLAQNSVNGIAVKLSPVEILLRCREYDKIYNTGRSSQANQTTVAKHMIEESLPTGTLELTKKKQAETRRQVIGVSRKLHDEAIAFLESSLRKHVLTARNAFTFANLKAIPKDLNAEQVCTLLSRIERGYHLSLPKPKALDASEVKKQATLALEAFKQVKKFNEMCGFDTIPREMANICERMKTTQNYDQELTEHEQSTTLFPPLVDLFCKSVPGGDLLMKHMSENLNSENLKRKPDASPEDMSLVTASEKDGDISNTLPDDLKSKKGLEETEDLQVDAQTKETVAEENRSSQESDSSGTGFQLQRGWHIEQISFLEFEKTRTWDDLVSHASDFAMMRLPIVERTKAIIQKMITHLGHALHTTGVAHVYCTISQYGLVEESVKAAGMYMARDAMLYSYDPEMVKRLTLSGQTQPVHQCAAVFWREPPSSKKKHYFAGEITCPGSSEPGWVSLVTGLSPPERIFSKNELNVTILR